MAERVAISGGWRSQRPVRTADGRLGFAAIGFVLRERERPNAGETDARRAVAPGQGIAELLRIWRRERAEIGPVLLLGGELLAIGGEAAQRTFLESQVVRP